MDYEKFNAKVIRIGNSVGLIIPDGVVKFGGYKIGDELKVMSKKVV